MRKKNERPDMGVQLGGFESLYSGDTPPATSPDPTKNAPETALESPLPARKAADDTKPSRREAAAAKTTLAPKAKWGEGRTRNTRSFSITDDLFERMKRAAFHEGVTLSELAERGLTRTVDTLEERRGEPYPPVPTAKGSGALDEL